MHYLLDVQYALRILHLSAFHVLNVLCIEGIAVPVVKVRKGMFSIVAKPSALWLIKTTPLVFL